MGKYLVNIIFGHKHVICEPFFKIVVAPFTTFGMQKANKVTFVWKYFRTWRYAKRQFPQDGVRRVDDNGNKETSHRYKRILKSLAEENIFELYATHCIC